ncbi:plasmid stabilization system [Desulfitobacterium hafniense DCB-2]|uniref:Plasmid stabilization system n=1 Tax=Desulfitobacterium hafniense (strain DSM 10664 / DCB-2) TaxID=272564 RepID=B8FUZ0_DESHD|nr:type II toxin-antitoxin system RelE/ParE family toxin [Desulfitobacterium hafniense]ACL18636.1 plasmid stabilization system [Desulfitobacterium hafniense DCB-2]
MNKMYQVLWTQTAQQDLRTIIAYIADDNITVAQRIYTEIRQKCGNLRQLPHQERIVPELKYHGITLYRELIIRPWRIIYKLEENKVWVLAVIDGRRNMEDILLNRFIL